MQLNQSEFTVGAMFHKSHLKRLRNILQFATEMCLNVLNVHLKYTLHLKGIFF